MLKAHHQKKARFAVQRGDFVTAADSLNELTRLEPNNIECALLAADMNKKIGLHDQASEHYASIARLSIEHDKLKEATHAISEYQKLCPSGIMLGRELYHLCRSKKIPITLSLPFLHEQDRLTFVLHEHPFFQGISDDCFSDLFSSLECLNFHDGDTVSRKGDTADSIYIIVEGAIQPWVEEDDGERYGMSLTNAGGITGETPFLTGGILRTADLIAVGESQIYVLSYDCLKKLIAGYPAIEKKLISYHTGHAAERQLAQTPFFRKLSPPDRREIADQMELFHVKAGTILFTVGEHHNLDLYVVHSGWLSVNIIKNKQETFLYTAKSHCVLGELGVLENTRKITVRTISDVQLIRWPEEAYRTYYNSHEALRYQLANRLLRLRTKLDFL